MTPERWQRARELFDAALERSGETLDGWLRAECGEDAEMLSEVREMLREHERTGVLDHPVWTPPAAHSAQTPVFAPGQVIAGRYRILRYLSRGGMGEVYEAEHQLLPDHVALKTLLPAIAANSDMIARFKQEIQLARRIAHPNVCRVFDLEVHPAEPPVYFLTMEFLPGETLSEHLKQHGRMSCGEALPLLRQMTAGLEAAHHAGIIHRDFKPSNVMLVRTGDQVRVVTTDFGLARSFHSEGDTTATMTNGVAGTLDYMAPELLAGAPASVRSDVYALGMVAYKMVTGTLPYPDESPMSAAIRRANKPIPSPRLRVPELDPDWERAILRSLETNPADRFASVSELMKALTGETPAMPPAAVRITRRQTGGAAAALAVVTGGGLCWNFWSRYQNHLSPEAAGLYQQGVDNIQAGAYYAATRALEQVVQLAPRFTPAHVRLSEAWLELGLVEKAALQFLVVRREKNSSLPSVDRLRVEALDLTLTRELRAAVSKYEEIRKQVSADSGGADIDLGRAQERAQMPDQAIQAYRRAAEGPAHLPGAWLRLAVLYSKRNTLQESESAFSEADRRYRQASNLEGLTELALQRGVAANRVGHFQDAAALLRRAMEQAHDTGNLQQEISARLTLANVAYATGDTGGAETLAQEALAAAQSHQMESLTVRGLLVLGQAHQGNSDYSGAAHYFEEALALSRRTGSLQLAALANLNLSSLYDRLNDSPAQIRAAKEALGYYQPRHWAQETFNALGLIGRAEQHQGNYTAALASFQSLLAEATRTSNNAAVLIAEESLGDILTATGDLPKALDHYQRLLALSTAALKTGYAARDCATTLARLGRFAEAEAVLEKADLAASTFHALHSSVALTRAEMALMRNQFRDCLQFARIGLKANPSRLGELELGRVIALASLRGGDVRSGRQKCEEAVATAEKLADPAEILDARMALLEATLVGRDAARAKEILRDLQPTLEGHPESNWRALSMLAGRDPKYIGDARAALAQLETLWGREAWGVYLKRPDLRELARVVAAASGFGR